MVTVVFNIREIFVIDHVPDKTHVFIWPYSPPALRNMLFDLMTQTRLGISRKYPLKIPSSLPIHNTSVKPERGYCI